MNEYYDSESQSHYENVPEYERFGDFEEETYSGDQVMPQQKKQPQHKIKYRLKTFDDDQDSDASQENNTGESGRRGPKLIKFKQKKPSERLANS